MTPTALLSRRRALGLSQAALAARLGLTRTTIVRWERGRGPISSPEILELALRQLEAERREA